MHVTTADLEADQVQTLEGSMRGLRIVLIGVMCGGVLVVAVLAGAAVAPAPETLDEVAFLALQSHGIPFTRVTIEHVGCIPAPENCQSYSGDIVVIGEQPARGRIVCEEPARRCALWVPDLNLDGLPVRDPVVPVAGGWLEAVRNAFQKLLTQLRL